MTLLADLLSTVFERRLGSARQAGTDNRPLEIIAEALLDADAETSGLAMAAELLARFDAFDDADKRAFFRHIARALDIDAAAVRTALAEYEAQPSRQSYLAYMTASEPRRQELIRRLNQVPGATARLVNMRADLLRLGREDPELQALDLDFRHLFASWFNRGFLVLRPINWQSPAHILEKIIAYEAVHAIHSWDDLRRRLAPPDRRCFAFFHPAMPDEPLIFVEVALMQTIPVRIGDVLADDREPLAAGLANTAVFYSISNCQQGLAGISFGNSLIKQVARDLSAELPDLKTFVTLSPVPGFAGWLAGNGVSIPADDANRAALAADYLLNAKRGDGLPVDPVARFHLGNGAILHAVHGAADTSSRALAQSGGVMVNYLYDLDALAQNLERFVNKGEVVAASSVRALAATNSQNRV